MKSVFKIGAQTAAPTPTSRWLFLFGPPLELQDTSLGGRMPERSFLARSSSVAKTPISLLLSKFIIHAADSIRGT